MSQKIKSIFLAGLPAIVIAAFLVAAIIYAWTEPSSAPPAGNVSAPLNVSTTTQYKGGALGIGGLLRGYSDAIFDGNVGIGTASPGNAKLNVSGNISLSGVGNGVIFPDGSVQTTAGSFSTCRPPGYDYDILCAPVIKVDGTPCPITKDCDGDGKTYLTGDCDENCATCFTGSVANTVAPDGRDQNCNGVIDESTFYTCNAYIYSQSCQCTGQGWYSTTCSSGDCIWTAAICTAQCASYGEAMISWSCTNTGNCCDPGYRYY